MKRHLPRALTILLIGAGTLVACGNDQDACAASAGNLPKPGARITQRPTTQRTTSRIQDRPRTTTSTSNKSNKTTQQRPTNWFGYNDRVKQHNWAKPYRKGYPVPQQPIIVNQYGHDYRTYPGYPGLYPVGVWPVGYGNEFGCSTEKEADPETAAAPLPAPTMTVTATPNPFPAPTPTPADAPR
jgi:hypothetical protein